MHNMQEKFLHDKRFVKLILNVFYIANESSQFITIVVRIMFKLLTYYLGSNTEAQKRRSFIDISK